MTSVLEQHYELVPLDRLTPHPENPREGDLDVLADSIAAKDFYGALVVQRSTGHILAGNHRYLAAKTKGLAELPVIWVDVDDDRARRPSSCWRSRSRLFCCCFFCYCCPCSSRDIGP